jgi:beta-lactamase regulating signal transducer with metallopeptidase domain
MMMIGSWAVDWNAVGEFMLATGMRGALLLSAVAGLALLLKAGSAARRHLVWTLGMVGLLALPFAHVAAPSWSVEVPGLERVIDRAGVAEVVEAAGVMPRAETREAGAGVKSTAPAVADEAVDASVVPSASRAVGRSTGRSASVGWVAPAAAVDTRIAESSNDWVLPLLGIWALGALLLAGPVLASHGALRRVERSTRPLSDDRVARELSRLAMLMGVDRPVRLLEGEDGQMPMSWGLLRPVILLPRRAERWPEVRLRAVLLHELAHVQRRDCLTQFVAEVALALHWPNPLAWVAVWRLRVEREHACDDRVLVAGAQATVYAGELLSLARGFRVGRQGSLAAVAMARPSKLESRLRAVLAEGRRRTLSRRGAAVTAGVALLLTTAVAGLTAVPATRNADDRVSAETSGTAAPSDRVSRDVSPETPAADRLTNGPIRPAGESQDVSAETSPRFVTAQPLAVSCGTEQADWDSSIQQRNDDRTQVSWARPGCEVEILMEGEVEFNSTFDDVARLDRNARLRIEEVDGRTERWLEITPGSGGAPEYEYRLDRSQRPFDAEAREWYQGMLLQVFRRAGFLADERVAAFLAEGGVEAVFQEMELLQTDHAYARYVEETIRRATLTEGQFEDLLDQAMDRVDSDHYMAQILEAVGSHTTLNDRMLDTFIAASRTLDSDHYRAEVLETALDRGDLSNAQIRDLLASASEIDSDHYQAKILQGVADRYVMRADLREAYLAAVERIESDHYMTEVLSGLLARSDLGPEEKATVLRAAAGIGSDHYVTVILKTLAERGLGTGPLRDAYFEVAAGIESDHYAQNALQAILENEPDLSEDQLRRLIQTTIAIESDHYRAALLVAIAERHRLAGATREAYLRAIEGIESRHYRGSVAEALLRNGG